MLFLSHRQVGATVLDLFPLGRCIQTGPLRSACTKAMLKSTQMRCQFWVSVKTSTSLIVLHETSVV